MQTLASNRECASPHTLNKSAEKSTEQNEREGPARSSARMVNLLLRTPSQTASPYTGPMAHCTHGLHHYHHHPLFCAPTLLCTSCAACVHPLHSHAPSLDRGQGVAGAGLQLTPCSPMLPHMLTPCVPILCPVCGQRARRCWGWATAQTATRREGPARRSARPLVQARREGAASRGARRRKPP